MKSKQLLCNDCGCRFEIKESKEIQPQGRSATGKEDLSKSKPASVSCPECRSYNITTA